MIARSPRHAVSLAWLVLLLSIALLGSTASAQPSPRYASDTLLVRFRDWTLPQERAQAHAFAGGAVHKSFTFVEGLQVVRIPPGMRVKDAIELYRRHPAVLYAEPNWIVHSQAIPNDPLLGQLWGLNNAGQSGGGPGADIGALEAWDLTTGRSDVAVTVVASGIDADHQDLSANLVHHALHLNAHRTDDD